MTLFPIPATAADPQRAIGVVLIVAVASFVLLLIFGEPLGRFVTTELSHTHSALWPRSFGQFILLGFDLFVGFALAVVIHETAHVIAGLWAGFHFHSLRISLLQFHRPLRISLFRGGSTAVSGWAGMIPVKTNAMALRMAAMVLAGPAANVLTGLTLLLLPFSLGPLSSMFVLSALFMGFLNLIPLQRGAELTDGMRVLRLIRCREQGERLMALAKLSVEIKDGIPPEDLSPDLLAKAIAIRDNSPETVIAYSYAFSAASSRQDDVKAAGYLETSLKYSAYAPRHIQQALMSEAAQFQAKRKRLDLAEQWLAAMPGKTEIPWLRASVEAAILEGKGDIEGALNQLDSIEKLVLAVPDQEHRERAHRFLMKRKCELLKQVATPLSSH